MIVEPVTLSSGPHRLAPSWPEVRQEPGATPAPCKAWTTQRAHRLARAESGREIAVVLLVALIGALLAAGVVLAPWHPAQATPSPITGFVTNSTGQQ